MLEKHELSDRLLIGFLQAHTLDEFVKFVGADPELNASLSLDERKLLYSTYWKSTDTDQFIEQVRQTQLPGTRECHAFIIFTWIFNNGLRIPPDRLTEIGLMVRKILGASSPEYALVGKIEAGIADDRGDLQTALERLDSCLGTLFEQRNSARADYARHLIYMRRADCLTKIGDFSSAHIALETAAGIAARWNMFGIGLLRLKERQAQLLWLSGQVEEALLIHIDPTCRELAVRAECTKWLFKSHISAAKCAIDCKQTDLAERELQSAREMGSSRVSEGTHLAGFLLLYSGQVDLQRSRIDESIEKINQALDYFQKMNPPYYFGVLEAKIALAEFALYEKNYRLFLEILKPLLAEAEERGCVDARSRLLLLQAYLFVTDDPPMKEAWDRVVDRVHLINNPAVLLKALSYLYHYALVQLEEREQAFMLSRLRRLETSLEKSCFESLYRSHVTARYETAIESRLARVIEKEEGRLPDEEQPPR